MNIKLNKWITNIASIVELIISIIVILAIAATTFGLVQELFFSGHLLQVENFDRFLGTALGLVVGVEFVKMLIKHTPGAAIEVLLYAIARQLIVEHTTTLETLIGILSIAAVFSIRKFLFIHTFDDEENYFYSADQTMKKIQLMGMNILPGDENKTVGEILAENLAQQKAPIITGASILYSGVTIRIISAKNEKIEKVEIIVNK